MNTTIALKLHSFGINKLHDPNWTGMELYDKLKQHVRQRSEPKNMLYDTIKDGLLFHLGLWVYEGYLEDEFRFETYLELNNEYLLWYLEDYIEFLRAAGVHDSELLITKTQHTIEDFNELYAISEDEYYAKLRKSNKAIKRLLIKLSITFEKQIKATKHTYSQDFAERVFHDRTLCEFISNLIIQIGFDGTIEEDEDPSQWIERKSIPNWAKKAISARDRGKCAQCGTDLLFELSDDTHFDHIVPLYHAGTNDLSNFQLLCKKCNLKKSKKKVLVLSSIPKYLQLKIN